MDLTTHNNVLTQKQINLLDPATRAEYFAEQFGVLTARNLEQAETLAEEFYEDAYGLEVGVVEWSRKSAYNIVEFRPNRGRMLLDMHNYESVFIRVENL